MSGLIHIFRHSMLSRKIFFYIMLISLLVAMVVISFQLYFNYKEELAAVEHSILLIKESHIPGIVASVYSVNEKHLRIQLDAALNIHNISYLEVVEQRGDKQLQTIAGNPNASQKIVHQFPLDYQGSSGKISHYGTLTVMANLDNIFEQLWSNSIKTLLFSIMII